MKIAVIGIGNILFQDEGIGCYAGKYLEENYDFSPAIEFVDGGTLGFMLMTYFQDCDRVIIIDTLSGDGKPGTVRNFSAEEMMGLGTQRQTAHEVEVVEMLEICSVLEHMAEVGVIGMIPEDIQSVNIDLCDTVKAAFPALIEAALGELERAGVTAKLKLNGMPLEAVIRTYSEPSRAVPA